MEEENDIVVTCVVASSPKDRRTGSAPLKSYRVACVIKLYYYKLDQQIEQLATYINLQGKMAA